MQRNKEASQPRPIPCMPNAVVNKKKREKKQKAKLIKNPPCNGREKEAADTHVDLNTHSTN
jgi:hypothetical protein